MRVSDVLYCFLNYNDSWCIEKKNRIEQKEESEIYVQVQMLFKAKMWPQNHMTVGVISPLKNNWLRPTWSQWCSDTVWCSLAELFYFKHPGLIWCQLSLHYSTAGRVLESWGEYDPLKPRFMTPHYISTAQHKLWVLMRKHVEMFLSFDTKGYHWHSLCLFGANTQTNQQTKTNEQWILL